MKQHNYYSIAGFLLIFTISVLSPLKKSLLSHSLPLSYIPWAQATFLVISSAFLFLRRNKFNPKAEYFGFLCLLLLLVASSGSWQNLSPIFGIIFFSLLELFSFRPLSLFWSSCHTNFSALDAKTHYPKIIFFGQLAASLAALSTYACSQQCKDWQHDQQLLFLIVAIAFAVFIALMRTACFKKQSYSQHIPQNTFTLWGAAKNTYAQTIFLLKILSNLTIIVLEFHLIALVAQSDLAHHEHVALFSLYYFLCQSCGIIFSVLPFNYLTKGKQLILTPAAAALLCSLSLFWPCKEAAMIALIVIKALGSTVGFCAKETLYVPTDDTFKCDIKPWIDLLTKPAAQALGLLINFVAASGLLSTYFGGTVALGCACLCLFFSRKAKKSYDLLIFT